MDPNTRFVRRHPHAPQRERSYGDQRSEAEKACQRLACDLQRCLERHTYVLYNTMHALVSVSCPFIMNM